MVSDETLFKCWHMLFHWTHHCVSPTTYTHTETHSQWICKVPTIVLLAWFNNYSVCFQHGNTELKMQKWNHWTEYINMRVTKISIHICKDVKNCFQNVFRMSHTFFGLSSEISIFDKILMKWLRIIASFSLVKGFLLVSVPSNNRRKKEK